MEQYSVGGIGISIVLGRFDDSELDLVVKAQDIQLGINPRQLSGGSGAAGGSGIIIKEASSAESILHWPTISIEDPNRRTSIYTATMKALDNAVEIQAARVGFFTMGLEVSRLPSWEIAEEIVKAINDHSKKDSLVNKIMLVASSPTQVSSFQYAITNISIISEK